MFIKLFEQYINDKNSVYDDGNYQIVISSDMNPSRISLWYDNKNVGNLYLSGTIKIDDEIYSSVNNIGIDKQHQGKGFGKKLYEIALKYINTDGIASYLPNRSNKTTVPSIYRRLNAFEKNDYMIIPKDQKEKPNLNFKDYIKVSTQYNVKPQLIKTLMTELNYVYVKKRIPINRLNNYISMEINMAIEYDTRKPKQYGYSTTKPFKVDLVKIKDITINDLIIL